MSLRRRIRHFLLDQRRAFRSLLRLRPQQIIDVLHPNGQDSHPSETCRCDPHTNGALTTHSHGREDHLPDCTWAKVMCHSCDGSGHCPDCGGDGVDQTIDAVDPDHTTKITHDGIVILSSGVVIGPSGNYTNITSICDIHCRFTPVNGICGHCGLGVTSHCELCATHVGCPDECVACEVQTRRTKSEAYS